MAASSAACRRQGSMRDLRRSGRGSMRDLSRSSFMGGSSTTIMKDGSMKDLSRTGSTTRRWNGSDSELSTSSASSKRSLGLKLSPDTRGDGLFRLPEGGDEKAKWPKLPFFNFSKRKLSEGQDERRGTKVNMRSR